MNWKSFGFLAVATALFVAPALAVDPVIHYAFEGSLANSGTGGSAYDGQIYTTIGTVGGTPSGSMAYIAGPDGQAIDFTNTKGANYGTFLGVNYTLPEQGTLAMWYKTDETGFYNYEPVFDVVEAPAAPGAVNTYNANIWEAWIYDSGLLRARADFPKGNYINAVDADLNPLGGPGDWYHIAMSWDKNEASNESLKLYVNGELYGAATLAWADAPAMVCFGGGNSGNDVVTGAYDDVRIYDSVVSAPEIAALAGTTPTTVTLPTPVIHYAFEGNLNNSGSAGATLDGIHVDGSAGDLSYAAGVNGQAISYDNLQDTATNGDFVKVSYTLPEEGTISVWHKPTVSFDYSAVWDNSVEANDWECWTYKNSQIRARIDNASGDASLSYLDDIQESVTGGPAGWEGEWYQITYTWSKEEGVATLYVNGKLANAGKIGTWIVPGSEFYLGGGNDGNEYSLGSFDDLMIFDEYISSLQAKALYDTASVPEPGTMSLILFGLLSLAGIAWRKRG